jgi:hypothetical protein
LLVPSAVFHRDLDRHFDRQIDRQITAKAKLNGWNKQTAQIAGIGKTTGQTPFAVAAAPLDSI